MQEVLVVIKASYAEANGLNQTENKELIMTEINQINHGDLLHEGSQRSQTL